MISKFFLILCIIELIVCLDDKIGREEFIRFKTIYQKQYPNVYEENLRYQIFALQLDRVYQINTLFNNRQSSYKLAINQYSDLAYNEFLARRAGLLITSSSLRSVSLTANRTKPKYMPKTPRQISSFDWRNYNFITPVKDQLNCGGCWAFAAAAALETQYALYYGTLKNLSEQNLIDCVVGNFGCNGGLMQTAYDYVRNNKGMNSAVRYPFIGSASACRYDSKFPEVTLVSGYVRLSRYNETELEIAVREVGPVSVGIHASSDFVNYNGGIFDQADCTDRLNHAVLVVGFNNVNNPPFWIIKNSWGTWWGESGYARMIKGKNICGIANMAVYPIVS